jgi:hypothetical protein
MKGERSYIAWKTDSKLEPIEGTDRVLKGSSRKSIVKHITYEEGVIYKEGDIMVRCKEWKN